MTRVLIVGAGVAGCAMAAALRRLELDVTVVERADGLRAGGHAVDVRGAALEVMQRLGLADALRAARTQMRGMTMVDGAGAEMMRSTEFALSSGRLDSADVEVLREDLVDLLHTAAGPHTQFVFGDSVTAIEQQDGGARVSFASGGSADFDLVVGADGLHSRVRRLAFGPEPEFLHHLGAYVGVFSAPNFLELDRWQVWLQAEDVGIAVYTARENAELRVTMGFSAPPIDYDRSDPDAQRRMITERMAGVGWETTRLLAAMWRAPDFYFDAMAQIRMGSWAAGRVVLIGDAAHCSSPLSGQGTSLAVVGAHELAQAVAGSIDDLDRSLVRYPDRMRRFAEINQALAAENPGAPASEESLERAKNAIVLSDEPVRS